MVEFLHGRQKVTGSTPVKGYYKLIYSCGENGKRGGPRSHSL